ncbi:MAG TPA: hypothetical protein VFJ16_29275 [Longimicrobium sp.]|nr:hypothetical protein [Longimicrobium sp.]
MIQRRVARLLIAVSLMVAWTTGGWAAACAQKAAPAHQAHAAHHGMHGGMHHHPAPAPEKSAPRGEMPDCPMLAMNGGTCLGSAQLPAVAAVPAAAMLDAVRFPALDSIRDSLLASPHFRPPEA